MQAGGEFGQDGDYGCTLIKVGESEQKLGQCERDFIGSAGLCFVQPLKKFLDGEMRTIGKEKAVLESKRLDLDACKNRAKKARSQLGQQAVSSAPIGNDGPVLIHSLSLSLARPLTRAQFKEGRHVPGTDP